LVRAGFLGFKLTLLCTTVYCQISQNAPWIEVFSSIICSISAAIALRVANELVRILFAFGIKVGHLVATQSRPHIRPEGVAKDYSIHGIVAFGAWCTAMFAISQL
jgi:hypothetical protein